MIQAISLILVLYLNTQTVDAEVSVSGLTDDEAEENVQLMLSLAKENCDAPEWKIQSLFEKSAQEIDVALRAVGYYNPAIEKSLTRKDQCWQADFKINQGPQTIIKVININVTGAAGNDKQFARLLKKMPLKKGSAVNHDQYESMKSKIQSLAQERGYLQGRFTENKLLIDRQNNSAEIRLAFDSGKRLLFGEVSVEQGILEPKFVKKYLSIKSGEFYSSEQLADTHNALSKSNYFEIIDIRPDLEHIDQDRVPVAIKLSPKRRHHYSFGAGFDTDIGPLLNAGYLNRRMNRLGHFFTGNMDLSPVLSTIDAEYNIPLANPASDFFSFGGGLKREDTDSYESTSATLSTRLKHAFANGWKQTLFIDYSYEDFTTGSESGQTLLLVPGANWLQSVSNNPLRPTKGHRLELEVRGSYKNPISDVSFLQGYFSGVLIRKLPLRGKFIGRTELGATLVDEFDRLSTTYRFYAGGITSVRGYGYKELGPKDNLGTVVGGQFLSVVSAEYEQAVADNWGVAAFVDTGNAFNLDEIHLKTGVGLGVRWYSPIGPVRVDFAVPLDESDSSFQIHFAAGARI
ncbi:MAG: autotransporter assembly complex protein TamA [Methylovulum sp.]